MKILAIIPARGGSKGVPKKNASGENVVVSLPIEVLEPVNTVQIELLQEGIYGNPQINVYINWVCHEIELNVLTGQYLNRRIDDIAVVRQEEKQYFEEDVIV